MTFLKISFSLIGVVLSASSLLAQTFSIGAKAGITANSTKFSYDNQFTYDPDNSVGLMASLQLERPLTSFVSLRLDGGLLQKGLEDEIAIVPEDGSGDLQEVRDIRARINYATFALLLKGNLPTGTYIIAGPRLDIKLGVDDDEIDFLPRSLENYLGATVFGFAVGVGQEFKLTPLLRVFLEAAYQHDLTDLYGPDAVTQIAGTLYKIESRAFSVVVGIRR